MSTTIRNDTGYRVFHKDSMKIAWDFITGETSVNKNEYRRRREGSYFYIRYEKNSLSIHLFAHTSTQYFYLFNFFFCVRHIF